MIDPPDKRTIAQIAVSAGLLGLLAYAIIWLLAGCCHAPGNPTPPAVGNSNGIPNLRLVEPGVWRGGQPDAPGFVWLKSEGITNIIKLNTWEEGRSDIIAQSIGMVVRYHPIDTLQELETQPDAQDLALALLEIKPGTFVHCGSDARTQVWLTTHNDMNAGGNDRTGLLVGLYRLQEGTNAAWAYNEMLTNGFHPALHGLHEYWENASRGR